MLRPVIVISYRQRLDHIGKVTIFFSSFLGLYDCCSGHHIMIQVPQTRRPVRTNCHPYTSILPSHLMTKKQSHHEPLSVVEARTSRSTFRNLRNRVPIVVHRQLIVGIRNVDQARGDRDLQVILMLELMAGNISVVKVLLHSRSETELAIIKRGKHTRWSLQCKFSLKNRVTSSFSSEDTCSILSNSAPVSGICPVTTSPFS